VFSTHSTSALMIIIGSPLWIGVLNKVWLNNPTRRLRYINAAQHSYTGVFEMRAETLTTSHRLHVELGKKI
jgi:hypothetical protein